MQFFLTKIRQDIINKGYIFVNKRKFLFKKRPYKKSYIFLELFTTAKLFKDLLLENSLWSIEKIEN